MSDRLSRSNSQSDLNNYGQGQPDDKNKDVDKKKDGATGQSGKNAGQGTSEKNKAEPQMKSKERKEKAPVKSDSDHGGKAPDTFGRLFLGKGASAVARKFGDSDESSSEDGAAQSKSKALKSPRQQQSDKKEKTANNKVPKLSLKNLGNALASLASDRPEMTISPRKTKRETYRNTQDSNSSTSNTAASGGTTNTTNTLNATVSDRTTNIVEVPLWQPASPRAEWNATSQSDLPASAKFKETNTTTQTGAETKVSSAKVEKNTTLATENENTVSKTAEVKKKVIGSVYADDLTAQSINTINLALSGTIVSGADLAELLVCFQSCGYKKSMQGSDTDSILRLGMTVKDFPDPDNPGKTIDVNIIEKVSEPFIKKYYDTPEIAELRIAAMQKYDEGNLKVPDELKKKNPSNLRDVKTYSDAMKPLVKMVSKKIMGETMNLSVAPMHNEVKELLKGIDACVIKWSKASGGVDKEKLMLARKSAISAYIATRSFMKLWFDVFADKEKPELKKYIHMTGYLTTMLTTRSDKFFYSVMSNAVDQDNEQKKLLEDTKNAAAFSSLGKQKKITGKQFATPEQRAERRAIKKEVDNFLSEFDESLIDSNFSQYLQATLASSKEDTLSFRTNPTQFALDNLNDYWFSIDSTDGGDLFVESKTLSKLKQMLEIKIDSENADDSGKTTTSAVATNTTTTTTTNTTTTTTNTNPNQASSEEEDTSPPKQ